jgi:hypothetical protein
MTACVRNAAQADAGDPRKQQIQKTRDFGARAHLLLARHGTCTLAVLAALKMGFLQRNLWGSNATVALLNDVHGVCQWL